MRRRRSSAGPGPRTRVTASCLGRRTCRWPFPRAWESAPGAAARRAPPAHCPPTRWSRLARNTAARPAPPRAPRPPPAAIPKNRWDPKLNNQFPPTTAAGRRRTTTRAATAKICHAPMANGTAAQASLVAQAVAALAPPTTTSTNARRRAASRAAPRSQQGRLRAGGCRAGPRALPFKVQRFQGIQCSLVERPQHFRAWVSSSDAQHAP